VSDLTKEQSVAAEEIKRWLNDPHSNWMMSMSGFAGTGKTYLLQRLINDGVHDKIICCAPTGKAASVLQSKLEGVYVRTIHQALYIPNSRSLAALDALQADLLQANGSKARESIEAKIIIEKKRLAREEVTFRGKDDPEVGPGKFVIVDESSMVPTHILDDMEKTGCKALFVGDSGQLPPVNGANWFLSRKHDASLTTIQRQAEGSPIIRLSQQIREGRCRPEDFADVGGVCRIIPKDKLSKEEWLLADQVLTGSNASRCKINRFFRKQLGYTSPDPRAGEKLICLKNDWRHRPPFINGAQMVTTADAIQGVEGMCLSAIYDGVEILAEAYCEYHTRKLYDPSLVEDPPEFRRGLLEVDYGYAITVHKSQGSEWGKVIVADDKMQAANVKFRQRWLYTAVTRASESLTIVS